MTNYLIKNRIKTNLVSGCPPDGDLLVMLIGAGEGDRCAPIGEGRGGVARSGIL